jgi:type IV secretion system protein VirB10
MQEQISNQTPVARGKRRAYGALVIGVFAVLILGSIWLQSAEPEKKENVKHIVTASQADTRRINVKKPVTTKTAEESAVQKSSVSDASGESASPITNQALTRAQQQQMRAQIAAAQRRLTAPSQAYSAKSGGATADSTNPFAKIMDANNDFANSVANQPVNTMTAQQQEVTDYKIFQGKIIPAVLDTAVNSDLPGMVRATISEDVYGETGREILLPRGSRLIGQYNSAVKTGQVRVYIMWTRAITPQQIDIRLASPGVDSLGRAGLAGAVDNHFWEIFGTSLLLSVMAAGVADIETNNSDSLYGNPYQYEVVESFSDNSNAILEKQLEIKPTITIDQGEPVRVMVAQDLDFSDLPVSSAISMP